jgi:hypothetical protein
MEATEASITSSSGEPLKHIWFYFFWKYTVSFWTIYHVKQRSPNLKTSMAILPEQLVNS